MKKIISCFFLKKNNKLLPVEGSQYTYNKKGAFFGISGIVKHHLCGTRFMINTGNCWITNIKP